MKRQKNTFDQSEASISTFNQSEGTKKPFNQSEASKNTFKQSEISRKTFNQSEAITNTFNQSEVSKNTLNQSEASKKYFWPIRWQRRISFSSSAVGHWVQPADRAGGPRQKELGGCQQLRRVGGRRAGCGCGRQRVHAAPLLSSFSASEEDARFESLPGLGVTG